MSDAVYGALFCGRAAQSPGLPSQQGCPLSAVDHPYQQACFSVIRGGIAIAVALFNQSPGVGDCLIITA
ncbi:hypothetical protein K1Y77_14040 [Halomonas qaidamensis]|uniref:Uncharacterized protein n=1 Tax=Halomonas qaidamensis TaxID=2866211 RepID=A0ABY6JPY6_9GAMM|nr:hypothetical protein [Halomonas qaidamensis]UYV18574.1 hypothetical protein K1Y77_14040 [Halomonas qaidamensis]